VPDHYAKLTRAVVEIGTQLRRLADAPTTPVADAAATTCSAQHHCFDPIRDCIRAAHHTGLDHVDEHGFHWSDTVAVYPIAAAPTTTPVPLATPCVRCGHARNWHEPGEQCTVTAGENGCGCQQFTAHLEPVSNDEAALRGARRDSLLILLSRAGRGVLTPDEGVLLRQHVETEMRDADTARAERDDWAGRCGESDAEADIAQRRADQAEDLLRVAHETSNRSEAERAAAVRNAEQADAVTAETKRLMERRTTTLRKRAEQAEEQRDQLAAAIERVRALVAGIAHPTSAGIKEYDLGRHEMATAVVIALTEPQ
jgi:hypothetical protein